MENEIWKTITDFENYQVSNFGRIKSLKYGKILNPSISSNGYKNTGLFKDKIQYKKMVHQLVAIMFLNHIPNGKKIVVNHKNFIRTDNRLENLEIITSRENTNKKHLKYTSKYVGVGWHKASEKWCARIVMDKKRIHIGLFINEIDAHNAYQEYLTQASK